MSQQTDALIAEAERYLGTVERPASSNRGVAIDYWMQECGLDPALGLPWCAAFVGQVGRQALGHRWPVPRTASVAAIAAWAATKTGVLQSAPSVGELFLLWSPGLKRFAHVGIITAVRAARYETIEGNTNKGGEREGYGVFARSRPVEAKDVFVNWEAAT